jgi:hypothetical protein
MATQKARQEFIDIIRGEGSIEQPWSERVNLAKLLLRHGATYARLQEANCNGVGTWVGESNESFQRRQNAHEAYLEKREQQIERRIRQIVAELGQGFGVTFGGDPRGATVKIQVPSGRTNDWGKEGICVPTA